MFALFTLVGFVSIFAVNADYIIGQTGESCFDACQAVGMNCNPAIHTANASAIFASAGFQCVSVDNSSWWANDQPSILASTGQCLGFIDVPQAVVCQGMYPTTRRLCRCDLPIATRQPFGTGYSQGYVNEQERTMFTYVNFPGKIGVMTHFWLTPTSANVTVRYYVDGEPSASIAFHPQLACGVGFNDQTAPWGTQWFGKGAATGAWFWNFRVPFQRTIRITMQSNQSSGLYTIFRGAPDVPIRVGEITVPKNARLVQHIVDKIYEPLEFVPVMDLPSGTVGVFFMHTLSFSAPDLNSLEGCYHLYSPRNTSWPGTVMSTGTEDFFDSAYYFDGGEFRLPVSGFTHLSTAGSTVELSAYRFHIEDPLPFDDGFKLEWRNGDMFDRSGIKCLIQSGGTVVGSPGPAHVRAYGWAYVWSDENQN